MRDLTDASGNVADTDSYDAFGNLLTGSNTTGLSSFLYDGQQQDATGLYYLRARYMDPARGEFESQDPFEGRDQQPISLHRYLYGANDPVDMIDPSGCDPLGDLLVTMAIGATIGGISSAVGDYALNRTVTVSSVVEGAAFGAVLAPIAVAVPAVGIGLSISGLFSSGLIAYSTFTNPSASSSQKIAATALIIASIYGAKTSLDYYNNIQSIEPNATLTINRDFLFGFTSSRASAATAIEAHLMKFPALYGESITDPIYQPDQDMLALFRSGSQDQAVINWGRHELAEIDLVDNLQSTEGLDFEQAVEIAHARVVGSETAMGINPTDRYTSQILEQYADQFPVSGIDNGDTEP